MNRRRKIKKCQTENPTLVFFSENLVSQHTPRAGKLAPSTSPRYSVVLQNFGVESVTVFRSNLVQIWSEFIRKENLKAYG